MVHIVSKFEGNQFISCDAKISQVTMHFLVGGIPRGWGYPEKCKGLQNVINFVIFLGFTNGGLNSFRGIAK